MHCSFCAIVVGDLPASFVYDDDRTLAFLDLNPATPGHLVVIPKRHIPDLAQLDPDEGAHVFRVAHRLALATRASTLAPEGVNLLLADGEAAGQEVFHVHLHVLPRRAGDRFAVVADFAGPTREELDSAAAAIRAALT